VEGRGYLSVQHGPLVEPGEATPIVSPYCHGLNSFFPLSRGNVTV
jgi:hypothetical protein